METTMGWPEGWISEWKPVVIGGGSANDKSI